MSYLCRIGLPVSDGTKATRINRIFVLDHGRRCLRYINLFFPTGIWGTRGDGLWLVDSMSFCYDSCSLHGGDGFVDAVSMQVAFS